MQGGLLLLTGNDILSLLMGREMEIMRAVQGAYLAHARGQSSLPQSTFLRFPLDSINRIIALPAYLEDEVKIAGVKWISSFPDNPKSGLDRASAVIILNSTQTGVPEALMEGSIISAKRTAASAALAAKHLRVEPDAPSITGLIGCGLINYEIVRFLLTACPDLRRFIIYDLDRSRARHFRGVCLISFSDLEMEIAEDAAGVLRPCSLISLATTASRPHIFDLSGCRPDCTVLHISLRDLSPQVILLADNVVDDIGHVCRAETSVHLAEQLAGCRDFIRCTLADILSGSAAPRGSGRKVTIFSPFGLGILDLAVADLAYRLAAESDYGTAIDRFLPQPWGSNPER
jgi:ornithine cyclodeaminase